MCEEYNGWTNRETWVFMLLLNNDQVLLAEAKDCVKGLEPYEAGQALQEWADGWLTVDGYAERFGDDMSMTCARVSQDIGSLYRVDWYECADRLLGDSKEDENP